MSNYTSPVNSPRSPQPPSSIRAAQAPRATSSQPVELNDRMDNSRAGAAQAQRPNVLRQLAGPEKRLRDSTKNIYDGAVGFGKLITLNSNNVAALGLRILGSAGGQGVTEQQMYLVAVVALAYGAGTQFQHIGKFAAGLRTRQAKFDLASYAAELMENAKNRVNADYADIQRRQQGPLTLQQREAKAQAMTDITTDYRTAVDKGTAYIDSVVERRDAFVEAGSNLTAGVVLGALDKSGAGPVAAVAAVMLAVDLLICSMSLLGCVQEPAASTNDHRDTNLNTALRNYAQGNGTINSVLDRTVESAGLRKRDIGRSALLNLCEMIVTGGGIFSAVTAGAVCGDLPDLSSLGSVMTWKKLLADYSLASGLAKDATAMSAIVRKRVAINETETAVLNALRALYAKG